MIALQLDSVQVGFEEATGPDGGRVVILVCQDPQSGILVRIPFDNDSARQIAAHLDGRPAIQVAQKMP